MISKEEVERVIKHPKDSAPGQHDLCYSHIKGAIQRYIGAVTNDLITMPSPVQVQISGYTAISNQFPNWKRIKLNRIFLHHHHAKHMEKLWRR